MKVYKIDKLACLKHIAAKKGVTLSYRSKTEESRRTTAVNKQSQRLAKSIPDKSCQHGPPDRVDNFQSDSSSRKRGIDSSEHSSSSKLPKRICISDGIVECNPKTHPEIFEKCAKMKFVNAKEQEQWYEGIISSYFMSDFSPRKRGIDSSEQSSSSKLPKRICVSDSIVKCIPKTHPEIIGNVQK